MKTLFKTFAAFVLFAAMTASAALHTVWFIPDWQVNLSGKDSQITPTNFLDRLGTRNREPELVTLIKKTFLEASIEIQDWPRKDTPEQAQADADNFAIRLAEKIIRLTPEQRATLTLVGHSRGANIVFRVMGILRSRDVPLEIRQFILLEPLVPLMEPSLPAVLQSTILPSICICDKNNYFRKAWHDMHPAQKLLGDDKTDILSDIFIQSAFTTTLNPQIKNIIDTDTNSQSLLNYQYAMIYLRCLQIEFWGALPPYDFAVWKEDPNALVSCDYRQPSTNSFNWWEPIDIHPDWILMQHIATGHCKITDAKGAMRQDKNQTTLWGECRPLSRQFDQLTADIIDIENYHSVQRLNSHHFWDVVKTYEGWELQKNNIFGNSRIVNATDNRCIKSGSSTTVNKAFEIVCQQADALKARPAIDVLRAEGMPAIRDAVWWKINQDHDFKPYSGWRLEKHAISGYCRIMDDGNRCRYAADEANAKRMFETIRHKLQSTKFNASFPRWTAPTVIWYIPGWKRCEPKLAPEHEDFFKKAFPGSTAQIINWNGNGDWSESVTNADAYVATLVTAIDAMKPEEREHLTLIGHSLGGRIVAKTVAELLRKNIKIQNACMLAAAIPFDDADAELALQSQSMPVISVYNPNDKMLKYAYRIAGGENSTALGAHSTGKPNEFRVSWNTIEDTHIPTTDINWDFVKSVFNHTAIFYLQQLKKITDSLY